MKKENEVNQTQENQNIETAEQPKKKWYAPILTVGKKAAPVVKTTANVASKILVTAVAGYTLYMGITSNRKHGSDANIIDCKDFKVLDDPAPAAPELATENKVED